ncbi:MAG: YdcF family protein [PVC group bacterium]|nr:YdcF family protein [PVC group bacterium]
MHYKVMEAWQGEPMFFIASKIFQMIAQPFNVVLILLASAWFLGKRNPSAARIIIGIILIFCFVCGSEVFSDYMLRALEQQVPRDVISENIDGIIVLVGIVNIYSMREGVTELVESADRIVQGVVLARQYPKAKLIITGASGLLDKSAYFREADLLNELVLALGISKDRIILERNARNTHEHATELSAMLPKDGKWVLVTSAFHMPRAVGCFKKAGFMVKAYPVDYRTRSKKFCKTSLELFVPTLSGFKNFNIALKEYIGLIVYRLAGYMN